MKIKYLLIFIAVTVCSTSCRKKDFRDASLLPEERATLLLAEMTLEEKVAQLHRPGEQRFVKDDFFDFDTLKKHMPHGTGIHFMRMYGTPVEYALKVTVLQKYLVENTRLGIPALFGGEGLHGFMAEGATYFPQAIALGARSTRNLPKEYMPLLHSK
jgi:beta-glucosidase